MKNKEWNRRDFIVKPILWAGAATVIGKSDSLFADAATPNASVIQRALGKTGITLPIVSMGVMNADIPGLLRRAYELGIRHFDTAAGYQQGRNEEMVGAIIKELKVRDKVVISTKQPSHNPSQNASEARKLFIENVEASLKRLQMDHVDILYHHAVDSIEDARAEGPLEALQSLKKDGKTRFIGLSTHKTLDVVPEVVRLGIFDVALVMLNYTMARESETLSVIERAAKTGLGIVAMKTQAGGTVSPDPSFPKKLPPESQTALLKWVLNHEFVTTAIPGFSEYEHLEQDFSVARGLTYTEQEKKFLADKTFIANAEFCRQCGKCNEECPQQVDVPVLMRAHMYAVQYRNIDMAKRTMAGTTPGHGLDACAQCDSCLVACSKAVQIGRKIDDLKALGLNSATDLHHTTV